MNIKNMTGYDMDDALDAMGLRRKSSFLAAVLPAVGLLTLGVAVGAGIGLVFAPSSGRRLRQEVGDRFDQLRERMAQKEAPRSGANAVPHGHQAG